MFRTLLSIFFNPGTFLLLGIFLLLPHMAIAAEQTLFIGNAGEPQTLDPHRYNLRLEETLLNDLFMGLTTFNDKGEIVPGAAQSWQTSDDGLIWTFHLRRNMQWSDGQPLNAEPILCTLCNACRTQKPRPALRTSCT